MSQKRTVTCFISPGSVLTVRVVAGFGWSWFVVACAGSSEAPHCPQYLCSGGFAAPHDEQLATSGTPHCPQNLMPAGLSALHWAHLITSQTAPIARTAPLSS